jgi:ketosteroid isomerase-like protein
MSQRNIDSVSTLIERWNSGEREISPEIDPAIELESPFSAVRGEPYRGHAGIREWFQAIDEQFSAWRIDVDDLREVDRDVLGTGYVHLRGRASGVELEQPFALVVSFGAGDRIKRVRIYTEIEAAQRAVGLDR